MKRIAYALAALALILSGLPQVALPRAAAQSNNTYTSATWGYSVTWDENVWFVIAQDDAEQQADLLLSNGTSFVRFAGDDTVPAAPLCVPFFERGINNVPDVTNVQPVLGPDGSPIRSTDPDRAFVALSFTVTTQGQTVDVAEYFECRPLVPNQSVLIIDHIVIPPDGYETEAALREELLTGVTIPDTTTTNPQGNATSTPGPTEQATQTAESTEPSANATSGPDASARTGELGPVMVSGEWRLSVVAAVRSPGLNAIDLQRKEGKEWVVVVADLTNWTNARATIVPRNIRLAMAGGGSPVRAAPVSSAAAAKALGVNLTDVSAEQSFRANQTRRVVLAYSVDENATDPAISFGTTLPLNDVLAQEFDLKDLPSVRRPPRLVQAEVDQVRDGDTLDVFLPDEDRNLTVNLLSVTAPSDGGCFADEAAGQLSDLAGSTVFLESAGDDASQDEVERYVWVEADDGTRTQVNREMLAGSFAVFNLDPATRFSTWLEVAEREARDAGTGIWDACASDLPAVTPEATETPTTAPTEAATATPSSVATATPSATSTEELPPTPTPTATSATGSPSASPSASASTDEPTSAMFRGGPSHHGVQPGPGLTAPAKLPWEFQTTSGIFSSATVVDGVVYVGSLDGSLYALNSTSGPALWQFTTSAGIISSPAVADGVVYFGSEDTNLYAVDAKTGREIWRFATSAEVSSSPAVVDGVVYVGGMDSYIYAVDAKSGAEIWKVRVGPAFS
ncbi:MAG TPA: PQQ-binding-like beta-propeller repeat protein, partial [Thermomicrobiales bacterium]|nr:PQQ-binding-like beta-propeller repeat protein [Thermomicrobiales bacterium]